MRAAEKKGWGEEVWGGRSGRRGCEREPWEGGPRRGGRGREARGEGSVVKDGQSAREGGGPRWDGGEGKG